MSNSLSSTLSSYNQSFKNFLLSHDDDEDDDEDDDDYGYSDDDDDGDDEADMLMDHLVEEEELDLKSMYYFKPLVDGSVATSTASLGMQSSPPNSQLNHQHHQHTSPKLHRSPSSPSSSSSPPYTSPTHTSSSLSFSGGGGGGNSTPSYNREQHQLHQQHTTDEADINNNKTTYHLDCDICLNYRQHHLQHQHNPNHQYQYHHLMDNELDSNPNSESHSSPPSFNPLQLLLQQWSKISRKVSLVAINESPPSSSAGSNGRVHDDPSGRPGLLSLLVRLAVLPFLLSASIPFFVSVICFLVVLSALSLSTLTAFIFLLLTTPFFIIGIVGLLYVASFLMNGSVRGGHRTIIVLGVSILELLMKSLESALNYLITTYRKISHHHQRHSQYTLRGHHPSNS
ncbi:hypothetical protein SAMD00019534_040280 [Acytostelium subglobosum LB1]|uniref:hypothetical protein n=1 Tax=Acytostelium subglobosum LB1 TaxID=1410327 RepID=UPI000644E412|nr:hypothetical protein SAMD00019534_040280 [Acytostelium subglobosum LB1]GAM20853.1 hypothetical protein SAMD00019534_040280 [Acytostelium subglobosum LB1]|eukprot:XP_012755987.1 hypothetical protein SAMD00019534_040280 [Acytostelium subglobosum LB1]